MLLRSENFFLFAGIGPLVEGYIIIAPHHCDWKRGGMGTLAEMPVSLLDELLFLRGIVFKFYEDAYGLESGLCFEHGRAGTCGVGETPHCYHAHLCCYPGGVDIARDVRIPKARVQRIEGISELTSRAGRNPYLLIQQRIVNGTAAPQMAKRTAWETFLVVLRQETDIPRQYLRKLLAARVNRPEDWDWAVAPGWTAVNTLRDRFNRWLQSTSELPIHLAPGHAPSLSFPDAVRALNARAYDAIGPEYLRRYKPLSAAACDVVAEFTAFVRTTLRRDPITRPPRVLDIGCGPGIHLEAFREAGFEYLGIDASPTMVALAQEELRSIKPQGPSSPALAVKRLDAMDLTSFADESFEGIWFSAVMVHQPRRFAQSALCHVRRLLVPGGVAHLSAQLGGDAMLRKEGRFFVYFDVSEVEAMIGAAGLTIVKRWHDTAHQGTCGDRRSKRWINYFVIRPINNS